MDVSFLSGYFGRPLHDFYHLFMDQVDELYQDFGLGIPVVCSSTLQLIYAEGSLAPADIARALDDPHQLVSQRLASLSKRGLITKIADPDDKRRSLISLTEAGEEQAQRLIHLMAVSEPVYSDIEEEIGVDLPAVLQLAQTALRAKDLKTRMLSYAPDLAKPKLSSLTKEAVK